jgi:hypothetical protein
MVVWSYVIAMQMPQNLTFSRFTRHRIEHLLQLSNYWLRCEHYSWDGNRDHLKLVLDESFDLEYIEAHFNEDMDELERIELRAAAMGYGPRVACTTVTNFSAQRICCRESVFVFVSNLADLVFQLVTIATILAT